MSHLIHSPVFEHDGQLVTSTLEIAEGTYVQHANVLDLINTHSSDFNEFGQLRFETRARPVGSHGGNGITYAVLNEQQATLLLTYMRNSDIVRAFKKRLVKAFYDLRFQRSDPMAILNDPAQLRGLLGNYAARVEALEATVAEQTPKVAALDAIAEAPHMYCMRDAAKHLGWSPSDLIDWLMHEHWTFRNHAMKRWVAFQTAIDAGWLVHKLVTIGEDDHGHPKTVPQVMVTSRGLTRIAVVIQAQQLERNVASALCRTRAHA